MGRPPDPAVSGRACMTVLYDGACPLCEKEIAFYRARKGAEHIMWRDVSRDGVGKDAPGVSREEALARFHIVRADGSVVSGGAAFSSLWMALPGFRWLGRLMSGRAMLGFLNWSYNRFLTLRPYLQAALAARHS